MEGALGKCEWSRQNSATFGHLRMHILHGGDQIYHETAGRVINFKVSEPRASSRGPRSFCLTLSPYVDVVYISSVFELELFFELV